MMNSRISVNQICFPGATIAQLGDYWKALQVNRVGCLSAPVLDSNFDALRDVLQKNNLQLETIAHVFMAGSNLSSRESLESSRHRLSELIDKAERLGARSIYMMTGGRGDLSWEQAAENFSEAIAPCLAQANNAGIVLAIENAPSLYADVHIAYSLRDALTLAEMAGVGICIELFACWSEAGLAALFERAAARCCLVQVSDYVYGDRSLPARAVPGDGAIPLPQIIEWLSIVGYEGAFDIELIGPRIDREGHFAAAKRAAIYFDGLLGELGVG